MSARKEKCISEQFGSGPEGTRRRLLERSMVDGAFRRKLLSDPKGAIEDELGASLPEGVGIRAVEETPETIYLVLPPRVPEEAGEELSDRELDAIAGGRRAIPPSRRDIEVE